MCALVYSTSPFDTDNNSGRRGVLCCVADSRHGGHLALDLAIDIQHVVCHEWLGHIVHLRAICRTGSGPADA